MHVITGEIRKDPRILDNGTIIIELAESFKNREGTREYTNYTFFFKAGSAGMQAWYDSAFKVGKVITVTCDALKINQREANGKTYVSLQPAGFANLHFSQFDNGGNSGQQQQKPQQQQQSNGWGKPHQPSPQNKPAAQQQGSNEPPMDFDDDIPFASIGLQYSSHAIHSI